MVWGVREVMAGNHLVGKEPCRDQKNNYRKLHWVEEPSSQQYLIPASLSPSPSRFCQLLVSDGSPNT